MLLNIELIKTTSMFCTESAAASVTTWLGRNYEMMFSKMWGFKFDSETAISQGILGLNIYKDYNDESISEMLEHYHGIKIRYLKSEKEFSILATTINVISGGMPILVFPYSKHCTWLNNSNTSREYILIIGYDDDNFYCLDIHNNTKDIHIMPKKNLTLSYEECKIPYAIFEVSANEKKNITSDELLSYIKKSNSLIRNPFNEMKQFADLVENEFDHEKEKNVSGQTKSPILYNIKEICRARKLISTTFSYVAQLNDDQSLYDIGLEFLTIGGEWNIIWNIIIKAFYNNYINKKEINTRIAERIRNIAFKEEKIINDILCNNNIEKVKIKVSENKFINNLNANLVNINLYDYLNDSIFNQAISHQKSSLNQINGFLYSDILPYNLINEKFNIPFTIYKNIDNNDNVCCDSQIIDINQGIYTRIMLLGCSFWGNGCGYIDIIYMDNYIEKLYVDFPDWYYNGVIDVPTIWTGNITEPNGIIEKRSLFCLSFTLEHNEYIKNIKLPENKNIHIFSIILEYL